MDIDLDIEKQIAQLQESKMQENIKKVVPATKEIVVIILNDIPGSETKFPAFSTPTEKP